MLLTIGIIIGVCLFIGLFYLANRELKKRGEKITHDFKLMWSIFSVSLCMALLVTMSLWMSWGHNNYPLSHYLKYDKFTATYYNDGDIEYGGIEVYRFILEYGDEKLDGVVFFTPGRYMTISLQESNGIFSKQVYFLSERNPRLAYKFWEEIIEKHKTEFEKIKK